MAEERKTKVRIIDRFMKPKFTEITIADPDHSRQNSGDYGAYTRIKIVDPTSNKAIFFGRIEFIEPRNTEALGTSLVLQCRDFLQELTENCISHDFSGPSTLGDLIRNIIEYHVFTKIQYSGAGGFTSQEHENAGNWIRGSGDSRARIIYVDTATKTLVVTDVRVSSGFTNGVTLTEYEDEGCTIASGVSDTQSGNLVRNIDTSEITSIGDIDVNTTKNYFRSSMTPLEAISQLCLHASSTGVYNFFLDESTDSSLFPPVFRLFLRESRPTGGAASNGLTIKYEGADANQERAMHFGYSFPLPEREIYTEARAMSVDLNNNAISSVKKAGEVAFQLETFKRRSYQALEHYNQAGLNNSVDRLMSMTGTASIQRGVVSITHYPYFFVSPNYTIVHTGELV